MQSNGNAVQTSDSKPIESVNISPKKEKKIPPKPPKRVSFDLKYRTIDYKTESTVDTAPLAVTTKDTSNLNGKTNNNTVDAGVEAFKGEVDKSSDKTVSPTKVNIDVRDKPDNKIIRNTKYVDVTSPTKLNVKLREDFINPKLNTTSERLRQEFVKSDSSGSTYQWPKKNSDTRSSFDCPLKSPTPNLSSRLSESQSKIAKLQQSLPTKLSDATVESLKNKYSPASFGYPKNFVKSPEPTRIPLFSFSSKNEKSQGSKALITEEVKNKINEVEEVKEAKEVRAKEVGAKLVEAKEVPAKLVETKEVGAKLVQAQAVGAKEVAAKLVEVQAVGAKEVEAKAVGAKEVEAKEVAAKLVEAKEVAAKLVEAKEVVTKLVKAKEVAAKLVEVQAVGAKGVEAKEVGAKLVGAKEVEAKEVGAKLVETKAVGAKEVEAKEVGVKLVEAKGVGAKLVEGKEVGVKEVEEKQVEAREVLKVKEAKGNSVTVTINNNETPNVKIERKQTFRSELYIAPPSTKSPEQSDISKTSDESNNNEIKYSPTVKAKLISSEIFPKEQTDDSDETVLNEDTSEQSSDTITESEDSQNIKYRNLPVDSDKLASIEDAENNNLTDLDDIETSSFTSEITYCEVPEDSDSPDKSPEMEDPKKKPQKKRSNSFKRIFGFGSSKDKKKTDDSKSVMKSNTNGMRKSDHMLSDNAQNEANIFDRNSSQRHTISGHYTRAGPAKENTPYEPYYSNTNDPYQYPYNSRTPSRTTSSLPAPPNRQTSNQTFVQGNMIEERLNQIKFDLYVAQQTNQQLNSNLVTQQRNVDEYVCMDNNDKSGKTHLSQPGFINAHSIDKYIDTTSSSSISTLESENRNIIYENTAKRPAKVQNVNSKIPVSGEKTINKDGSSPSVGEKCYERPKFADSPEMFTTTPRRTQGPQLIKPKAIIPLNTERPLPNPYRSIRDPQQSKSPDNIIRENLYGNLPSPEHSKQDSNLNDNKKQYPQKESVYGKPVVATRRNIPGPGGDYTPYGNILKTETGTIIIEDDYGTVYDSLTPVSAQLVVSKPQILPSGNNMEKRSRSVSPSQKHKATNLLSSQSFNHKTRPPQMINPQSPSSPVEATKLHLPTKRETAKPRLKSPIIEDRRLLIKKPEVGITKKENKNNTPSHQNLEIEIDYPENNLNETQERKETPEKFMFPANENVTPTSPKRSSNIKRSSHVSPNRPNFTHSTPKHQNNESPDSSRAKNLRSPLIMRSDSPASISSSLSLSSMSNKSKQQITSQDVKDLKNTEVYFYEQTTHQTVQKDDASPDQSSQQVLTQATVHQPKSSPPRRAEPSSTPELRRTPVNVMSQSPKPSLSPQKQQNRQNVEAFCWQQLKKLKEKEEQEIYNQQVQMMARQNATQSHRSRSLSAGPQVPAQRRSASLPRDSLPRTNQRPQTEVYGYVRPSRTFPIPEGAVYNPIQHIPNNYNIGRQSLPVGNPPNFIRGSPQRSTVGPINTQKRSHLNSPSPSNDLIYENYFPGVDLRHQAKSIQSGYAPIFKKGSLTVGPNISQDTSPQTNKKVSFSNAQDQGQNWPTKNGFTQSPPTRRVDKRTDSMDDDVFLPSNAQHPQQVVVSYNVTNKLPPPSPHSREVLYVQREPVYGRTQIPNSKQITVTNKVCDMYGQIHEVVPSQSIYGQIQKTGVLYGQLQPNPLPGSPLSMRNQCLNRSDPSFVRGTRLTASFNDMRSEAPRRPLPPIPGPDSPLRKVYGRVNPPVSESESGSEAGEVQRILAQKEKRRQLEEEWNSDSKSGRSHSGGESGRGGGDTDGEVRSGRSARSGRRDDPRRHTLSGSDPHYPSGMSVQGGPLSRTMDLEMPMPRGYPPPSSAMLFDDDPGIMSEVETSSTGFRRGGKQRSSLPVVRTPSKTLERPLGLVFLQYRNETKRALLPNEITSIDTVKALFVRSFPKQLTMEYLDSPLVKIYIHDSSKDMFYELEDLRSHLRDIRDRSVLRLFESADVSGGLPGPGTGISGGVGHFEDQSYFSEPEFDSEYQHQHIHKSKTSGAKGAPPYYMGSTTLPRGGPLLRAYSPAIGGPIPTDRLKTLPTDRIHNDGYMSSPERSSRGQYEDPYYSQYAARSGSITPVIDEEASDTELLDESYSLYGVKLPPPGGPRAVPAPRTQFSPAPTAVPYDATRLLRVENMERQLANLTGLVQKALHQTPPSTREFLQVPGGRDSYRPDKSVSFEKSVSFSDEPPDMNSPKQHSPQHAERDRLKPAPPPKPASLSPAQYDNSRHIYRDLQLTPEMYNQLRGLQKKAKDLRTEVRNLRRLSQAQAHSVRETIRDTFIKIRAMLLASGDQVWQAGIDQEKIRLSREEDLYKQEMIRLEKDLTELEATVEELRGNVINRKTRVNMSDVENMALILSKSSKTVADLKLRFPGLQDAMKSLLTSEMEKVVREEKFLKEEPERLESALRRCKKLTGTLVTLKRLASVQEQRLPCSNSTGDGRLSPTLTETPPITPPSAQHSKPPAVPTPRTVLGQSIVGGDSTGSSSCDGQRPENALDALLDELQTFSKPHPVTSAPSTVTTQLPQAASYKIAGGGTPSMGEIGRKGSMDSATLLPVQNLTVSTATGSLRRLHSYPSGSDTDNSPPIQPLARGSNTSANKPPIPERNAELLQHLASGRRVPPPPPPRTSSKSPLASPTSPSLPPRSAPNQNALQHIQNVQNMTDKPQSQFEAATQNLGLGTLRRNVPGRSSLKEKSQTLPRNIGSNLQVQVNSDGPPENKLNPMSTSNSSSCESVNSQEGAKKGSRKEELEQRHQELLKKQKALQEQYARLQQLQRGNNTLAVVPPAPDLLLKKTGSESNLLQKMGLQMAAPQQMSGSLTHLANASLSTVQQSTTQANNPVTSDAAPMVNATPSGQTTTAKVYETDIL